MKQELVVARRTARYVAASVVVLIGFSATVFFAGWQTALVLALIIGCAYFFGGIVRAMR